MQAMLVRRVEEAGTRTERRYCGSQVPGLGNAAHIPSCYVMKERRRIDGSRCPGMGKSWWENVAFLTYTTVFCSMPETWNEFFKFFFVEWLMNKWTNGWVEAGRILWGRQSNQVGKRGDINLKGLENMELSSLTYIPTPSQKTCQPTCLYGVQPRASRFCLMEQHHSLS